MHIITVVANMCVHENKLPQQTDVNAKFFDTDRIQVRKMALTVMSASTSHEDLFHILVSY